MDRSPVYVGTANTFQRASETPGRAFFLGPAMPDERKLPREHQELAERGAKYQGKFAVAGEWVTCERGHRIVEIARDIPLGALYEAQNFKNWQQPEPPLGIMEQPCVRCGAKWFMGMALHFEEGWR
jgi:hypothetical protein